MTEMVKDEARRLGFQLVGVTTPEPPIHFTIFEDWLADGRHGEMGYLATPRARQRRADPRQILPECRSILVLGVRYPAPEGLPQTGQEGSGKENKTGRVAAYAWGADYHDVLAARMRALISFIEAQVGQPVPYRAYTDTGPILERDLAQRAGLGWIGKNTCLIHPRMGSYFLLAEILLGIELDPDPPFASDQCGTCTRCLDACPTGCILPDRTLDARRCISYLTIELKGAIPLELRSKVGEWVFGCDICQQVCPWNLRFAEPQGDPELAPRPGVPYPDLLEEISLTPQSFSARFHKSPVKRARRRGYLRNVAVALGNRRDASAVPALALCLRSEPEAQVRAHAAWALGQIGGEAARRALAEAAEQETDEVVLREIKQALEHFN
jgi:epoxyqueuosine reductase